MAGFVDRVKNILLTPKQEWPVIDGEPGDTKEVFTYVAILAAIPLVFAILGGLIVAPLGLAFILVPAIVGYILAFAIVYLVAMIANALAPTFNGEKHLPSALKLVAYSYTPAWLGGIFNIIPGIGWLIAMLASLYSIYLLYLGVPTLMRSPQDKAVGYTIVLVLCALVLSFLIGAVLVAIFGIIAFSGGR